MPLILSNRNENIESWMNETRQSIQQTVRDEVLRKIGSNLLLFQQIEGLLKLLLGNSQVQGTSSDMIANQEQRIEEMQGQMMGLLVKKYVEKSFPNLTNPCRDRRIYPCHGYLSHSEPLVIANFMKHNAELSN